DGTTSVESFIWDAAIYGVGSIAQATSTDGIGTSYTYDTLGRLSKKEWSAGAARFAIDMRWDSFDRLKQIEYPEVGLSRLTLEYDYQPDGTLYRVRNPSIPGPYWTLLAQDATGSALKELYGTSITTTRVLDSRGRLQAVQTTAIPPGSAPLT